MTDIRFGPIITDDDFKPELRKRKSQDIFKTVTGSTKKIIAGKVELEEADGWRVAQRNKKSTRMATAKPQEEQLEDEIWCILAQMGFKEMSHGRDFKISVGEKVNPRQIDVFAKDDEAILIVECTRRETPGKKNMSDLIQKIRSIKEPIHKSVIKQYGRDAKLKAKYAIATRNISWSSTDLKKCEEADIIVISDNEIDYYKALVQHLKTAARFQLLAHFFGGTGVSGLATEVVATRGKMGGDTFYTFLIRPDELLKIAYVGHKSSRNIENLETYQRMLQPNRLKKIAIYINDDGKFPTNIVVNLKTKRRGGLRFDEKQKIGNESFGILHLPANYASAWIIDGQHRLYGYAYARENSAYDADSTTIPVLAYENMPADKEMNLFIDINSKQVKVAPGLLSELYSDLHWKSNDVEKAFQALLSRVASRLNSEKTSPLCERMVVTGKKKTAYRSLTQTAIQDGLKQAKLLGSIVKGTVVPGPFSTVDPMKYDENLKKGLSVISECVRLFSEAMPEHWSIGDGQGGYLCTNIGQRALFHVLKDLSEHVAQSTGVDLRLLSADETFEEIKPLLLFLVSYFKNASPQEISAFRQIGSSLSLVQQQAWGMEAQIHSREPKFNPTGMNEYLESRDAEGTEEAATKVRRINDKLFKFLVGKLQDKFGSTGDKWWTEGVPYESVRKGCSARWEIKREGPVESYLYLKDYVHISVKNWDLVKDVVSLDANDKMAKTKNVKWINELNTISQKTKHPEKGPLSVEQVARVNELYDLVLEFFPDE